MCAPSPKRRRPACGARAPRPPPIEGRVPRAPFPTRARGAIRLERCISLTVPPPRVDRATERERGFPMDTSVMFLDCPAYLDQSGAARCGLPAAVEYRYAKI